MLNNKRVVVTGCCGTVGSELVRQLLKQYNVGELIGLDNNESELFFTEQKYLLGNPYLPNVFPPLVYCHGTQKPDIS